MSMSNTTKRVKEIRRKTRRKFSSEEFIITNNQITAIGSEFPEAGFAKKAKISDYFIALDLWRNSLYSSYTRRAATLSSCILRWRGDAGNPNQ